MTITILEETKGRLVVDIPGFDATVCNALKVELYNDDKVKAASYVIPHPSIGIPRVILETSGKAPREAIVDAAKRLKKTMGAFGKSFEKEFA